MESWRKVWREGIAPQLPTEGLAALRMALLMDSEALIQGATTKPPPLQATQDWPVEAGDAIVYAWVMVNGGFDTAILFQGHIIYAKAGDNQPCRVAEAEEFFARVCFECDRRMEEPAACRHWINWWDEDPRDQVFKDMIPEVERELVKRVVHEVGLSEGTPPEIVMDKREELGLEREPWIQK